MRTDVVLLDEKGERIGPIVVGGRPDKGMPPFMLNPAQVADVAAFLHSLPVSSRTGDRAVNIVVGDANAGEKLFGAKCGSCHSSSDSLNGVASRYADPKLLQQTWLMPGTGGTRGGGQPQASAAVVAVVTLANGEKVEGTLSRIDDFVVSLRLADGEHRSFRTTGRNAPKVELRDPLRGHGSAPDLQRRRHSQRHRVSGDLEVNPLKSLLLIASCRRGVRVLSLRRGLDPASINEAARRIVAHLLRRLHRTPLQLADADQSVECEDTSRLRGRDVSPMVPGPRDHRAGRTDHRSAARALRDIVAAGATSVKGAVLAVNGVLYVTTPDNTWALDAHDGHELWHYFWKTKGGTHIGNRGVGMWGNYLFFVTPDDYIVSR